MDKKMKIVVVGLAAIVVVSLVINFQLTGAKQTLLREREELKRENNALSQKIESSLRDNRQLENRISSLSVQLDDLSRQKDELAKRFDLVNRERQELADKLKERQTAPAPGYSAAVGSSYSDDAYWAGILRAKTDLEMQIDNIRNELKLAQIANEQLQREKSALALEVTNLGRDKQDLKRQMDYNQKLMDSLAQELVREKNDKFQIDDALKTIKNENTVLRRQLRGLDSRKIALEVKLAEVQKDNLALNNRLKEMETMLSSKSLQIDNLRNQLETAASGKPAQEKPKESVELPTIVVRPQPENIPAEEHAQGLAPEGKIIAVNKDNNFVIIDLGEESGVKPGDVFAAYRQDQLVANIEVIQVREKIAACDIKKEKSPIKVGDIVR
jgi:chromosome segregation ATPase